MILNSKISIIGSVIAFIIATSCCWLPAVLIALGGGTTWIGLSQGLESFSGFFAVIGFGFLLLGIYYLGIKKHRISNSNLVLLSAITCPICGVQKEETMPTDACQYFYECEGCHNILKPKEGDCCVYCSYGTVPCPPIQSGLNCC